jgi:uncharacterized protein (TIGR02246 family)
MTTMTIDDAAVLGTLDTMYAAWAAGDADGLAAQYTQDATAIAGLGFNNGREAIRAFFEAGFAGRLRGSRVLEESRDVRPCGPGTAIVISQSGILMAGEDSMPAERLVRGTWVLTEQDGQWLIAAFHSSPVTAG